MNQTALVIGIVAGFVGACAVDLHAYGTSADGSPFNWRKAIARWIAGGLSGALTAAGLGAVV